jgi:hypothetical protein
MWLDSCTRSARVEHDADGKPTRTIHMLTMFLINRAGMVREIYGFAYLQPAVMLNDMRTLARESRRASTY